MRKADLIDEIAERTGITKKDVSIVVNELLEVLKEAFLRKERVELRGFGVFKVARRKPRVGRNPKTNEEVKIPERDVVVFRPSKLLKEQLEKE